MYFVSFTIINNIIYYHCFHPELLSAISCHILKSSKEEYIMAFLHVVKGLACGEGVFYHPSIYCVTLPPIYVYMRLSPWFQTIMTPLNRNVESPPPDYYTALSLGRAEWGNNRALFYFYFLGNFSMLKISWNFW